MPGPSSPLPLDDRVGVFVPHSPPPQVGAANGALTGRRFAVKDLFDMTGFVTGGGSPDWLRTHSPATHTSPLVTRLLLAGADFVGKTICDEFFYSVSGENAHYGTPTNVRAPGRVPGGSSSGSAAAVAAALCDIALGSDTGGSIRVPAAFCGIYGIRPTHGRVALEHAMPMAPTFDTAGWFVRDAKLMPTLGGLLLQGQARVQPITRVLIALDAFALADPEVRTALHTRLRALSAQLPALEPIQLAPLGFDIWRECLRLCQGYEVWQAYGAWVRDTQPALGPGIRERMQMASTIDEPTVLAARSARQRALEHLESICVPGTVVCLPTAPCIAPLRGLNGEALAVFRSRVMALTCSASLSGLPQINIPAGEAHACPIEYPDSHVDTPTAGVDACPVGLAPVHACPVGLGILGWRGSDEVLLDLAAAVS